MLARDGLEEQRIHALSLDETLEYIDLAICQ
ncbi:hypothetical protein CBA19CS42_34845 [Caballeronia novacaledonica]|uniref:Uncharacterized protein n=1 Tax=Caballeronia novacaledonica TaxID=1544861 RepID=A0AA37IHK2_9BURK|nr:hypothetical protein CBA19CS42_34845 [Caballeronia novacaledonica]